MEYTAAQIKEMFGYSKNTQLYDMDKVKPHIIKHLRNGRALYEIKKDAPVNEIKEYMRKLNKTRHGVKVDWREMFELLFNRKCPYKKTLGGECKNKRADGMLVCGRDHLDKCWSEWFKTNKD